MAQDRIDVGAIQWQTSPEERKKTTEARVGEATAPYAGPRAGAELESTEEGTQQKKYERADKMRGDFEGSPDYKRYSVTIPALEAALTSSDDTQGDLALTYYAAKLFDPDSAVREGEQETMRTAEAALNRMGERIRKEFGIEGGATFTDEGRARLRQQLIRRAASLNKSYNRLRNQYSALAERRGYLPEDVVGTHIGSPFLDTMRNYDEQRRRAGAKVGPVGQASTSVAGATPQKGSADVFAGPPPGTQIGGELIEGFRFTPEGEQELLGYVAKPNATPEGYAAVAADRVATERKLSPEQRDAYYRSLIGPATEYFKSTTPEQRAATSALDYLEADKAATENAGLGASVAQAMRNAPESAAQLLQGLVEIPGSAIASAVEREPVGGTKTVIDLAREGGEGPTTEAALAALRERYGNLSRTAVTDPLGLMADISIPLTLGGGALRTAGGTTGKIARLASRTGEVLDPVSGISTLLREGRAAAQEATRRAPGITQNAAALPSEVLALPSGVGGSALREAFGAGAERGPGAATPRSEALTRGMRSPEAASEDVVAAARDAVSQLREDASARYRDAMQQFGQTPEPLPIANVITRLQRIKPKNFDAMLNAPSRPAEHVAWERMMGTVQHYAQEALDNPALLEPLSMDAFKQDLYDIGSKVGGAYDRSAARIAGTAYNAVRDELVKHDPLYARTMGDYERAAREAQQIEETFGLGAARGKQPNVDRALRRLQSIYRNNAYTNYGQRAAQAERLAEKDATGSIMPTLAGQQLSSWTPRGLQRAASPATAIGAGFANLPLALSLGVASSPRIAGEAAYGAGRLYGTGREALGTLSRAYEKAPTAYLGAAQAGSRAEETDREALLRKYLQPPVGIEDNSIFYPGME